MPPKCGWFFNKAKNRFGHILQTLVIKNEFTMFFSTQNCALNILVVYMMCQKFEQVYFS